MVFEILLIWMVGIPAMVVLLTFGAALRRARLAHRIASGVRRDEPGAVVALSSRAANPTTW